jgi:hypothetical protein
MRCFELAVSGPTSNLIDATTIHAGQRDCPCCRNDNPAPAVIHCVSPSVGAVLASRRPRHPVGWLLLALALSLVATAAAAQYLVYGLLARPGALPAARSAALYYPATVVMVLAVTGFVLLLTPTGHCPRPTGAGRPGPW